MSADLELESEGQVAGAAMPVRRGTIALKLRPVPDRSVIRTNQEEQTKKKPKARHAETFPYLHGDKELAWNQKLLLSGSRVKEPNIHICENCNLPVIVYGRLKRCKHSFCLGCTQKSLGKCPRCGETGQECERGEMGSVYICSFGGSRHGHSGCRRSYLSQRDLQAHIRYRHEGGQKAMASTQQSSGQQDVLRQSFFPHMPPPPPPPAAPPTAFPLVIEQHLQGVPPFFPHPSEFGGMESTTIFTGTGPGFVPPGQPDGMPPPVAFPRPRGPPRPRVLLPRTGLRGPPPHMAGFVPRTRPPHTPYFP